MYFRWAAGSVKGVSKPGWIVWSRVFVMDGRLHCDLGVAKVVALPEEGDRAAVARDHAAMADHARGAAGA
jgi:hypothetical protein